ncbi:regulator of Vps4 activity in the MVB pathway-domain-containing protein, partial [Aspergillus oleicola]
EPYYLDSALDEASVSIFYAWSRFPTEVRELTILRSLLADRYGKDFMTLASENKLVGAKVPERLVKGLRVRPPSAELVESYLLEIARAYKVPWGQSDDTIGSDEVDGAGDEGDDIGGPSGGDIPLDSLASGLENEGEKDDGKRPDQIIRRASETAELNRATPPRGFDKHSSPVSVAPPGARSDNPNPRVRVPGAGDEGKEIPSPGGSPSAHRGARGGNKAGGDKSGIPDVDELSRRFAALKR